MLTTRVIPVLLLKGRGLVKTKKFADPVYLGDPINIVKIFNEKEVDELLIVDITSSAEKKPFNLPLIKEIVSEAFMPVGYGGGVTTVAEAKELFRSGIEKISLNSATFSNPNIVNEIANFAGNQSVIVSIDVKKNIFGKYVVYTNCGKVKVATDPVKHAIEMVKLGAGEILINSIDKDGTMAGYDLEIINKISTSVDVPVIACGGAKDLSDFKKAIDHGASAVAAGSMFVFQGIHKAVLISYPSSQELKKLFTKN